MFMRPAFIDSISLRLPDPHEPVRGGDVDDFDEDDEDFRPPPALHSFPFNVPAIRALGELGRLEFHPEITFLIGENGSGKSTLLEAIADIRGHAEDGGTKNFKRDYNSEPFAALRPYLRQSRTGYPSEEFYLRAESFMDLSKQIDNFQATASYGGVSLLERSHGEGFMALLSHRLEGKGLYLFDEPEAALSVQSQFTALGFIHSLIQRRSQFIIATHSPILLAYPGAWIYRFSAEGIERVEYTDCEPYVLTRAFLDNPQRMLARIIQDDDPPPVRGRRR